MWRTGRAVVTAGVLLLAGGGGELLFLAGGALLLATGPDGALLSSGSDGALLSSGSDGALSTGLSGTLRPAGLGGFLLGRARRPRLRFTVESAVNSLRVTDGLTPLAMTRVRTPELVARSVRAA